MRLAVLGSLQVDEGRTTLSPRDRVVLLALATRPGSEVSIDSLAQTLWGEDLPGTWLKVVQGCVVRLRKALGADAILTAGHGYRLMLHHDEMDHAHFEDLLARARRLLSDGEPDRALFVTGQALALWRGVPFEELLDWDRGRVESERLLELRRDAEDLQAESQLRAGRHEEVLAQAPRLVAEQPTREERWARLARAQYRAGRQADALATLHRARLMLVNELGLDPGPGLGVLEESILRQDPELVASMSPVSAAADCPYLGLVPYDVTDADTFFGREADIATCLRRLDDTGVLAILGPSGIGKSSLARAGVGAALARDGRRVHVITPGTHPATALDGLGLRSTDVLVVDQFEEALALEQGTPERERFVDRLAAFADAGDGLLVLSMRADRLGELSVHPGLAAHVERGLYLLGPMGGEDLRHAIEGSAAQAGLRLEPGLVDLLLHEVERQPAALPLLSHVLRQTWEHREGSTLTVAGYTATGGVRGAVARSAEMLFRGLDDQGQSIVRELMLRLVSPDEGGDPVRTRVPRRAVAGDAAHSELVERLVAARLLASDGVTIEIAHEALAVAWPRLRSWLDEDVDGLRIMRHLSVAADSWNELGRPDSELYRGTRQARAAEWRARAQPSLTPEERDFLQASAALAEKEERETQEQVRRERLLNRRLRAGLAAVAALLAVSLVAGALAMTARSHAERQALVADARRLGAEALRSSQVDTALLLAVAGARLDDAQETRSNLLSTLDRARALAASTRSSGRVLSTAVNPVSGEVATMSPEGTGFELYEGASLRHLPVPEKVLGGSVHARPDGTGYVVSVLADLVADGEPALLLLDRTGARSPVQLGGLPAHYHSKDAAAFAHNRSYLGFSADGRWLAASLTQITEEEPTGTFLWDLRSPSRLVTRLSLGLEGSAPTISPDGQRLYSADYRGSFAPGGGRLLVTDLPSGRTRAALTPGQLGIDRVDDVLALSPDGRTLAVAAGDETVLVDTDTLAPRAHLSGQSQTHALAFSADGTRLAATGDRLVVWDLTEDKPVTLLSQVGDADDPGFSSDGRTVYTGSFSGLVQAWDLEGGRRFLRTAPTGEPLGWSEPLVRFSPDLRRIGYTQVGPAFRVRDMASGALGQTVTPKMLQASVNDLAWHPGGTILNVTSGAPVVGLWDATSGRQVQLRSLGPPGSTEGAYIAWFSADGKYLLVGTDAGRLHVLDATTLVATREPVQVYRSGTGEPLAQTIAAFRPSGDLHTAWLTDAIVDYVSGTVRPMPDLGVPVLGVYPSPDGGRVLVDAGRSGVGILDAHTLTWVARPTSADAELAGDSTVWNHDGTLVASVNMARVTHWDGQTGARLGSVTVDDLDGAVAFSADDRLLHFAGSSGSLLSWNLDPVSWRAAACRLAGRQLTKQEWQTYLPNRPFTKTCPT